MTLWAAVFLHVGAAAAAPPTLYGLTRVRNSAACTGAVSGCTQLVSVNATTGTLKTIGSTPVQTLAAVGDLVAIDEAERLYYFLGDGWNGTGTWLVGLSLDSGEEVRGAPRRRPPVAAATSRALSPHASEISRARSRDSGPHRCAKSRCRPSESTESSAAGSRSPLTLCISA
jgi:hypothetical protein